MSLQKNEMQSYLEEDSVPNCAFTFSIDKDGEIDLDIFWDENSEIPDLIQGTASLYHIIHSGKLKERFKEEVLEKDGGGEISYTILHVINELENIKKQPLISPEEVF